MIADAAPVAERDAAVARFERFDPRPGGGYRMVLDYDEPSGGRGKSTADSDVVEARFVELEPDRRVVQAVDFVSDDPAFAGTMTMHWELEPVAGLPPLGQGPVQGSPGLDPRWAREPRLVRVTGFGPLFDEGAYEQEGHIRIDFGSDAAFLEEDAELDAGPARHVEENVRQLVELTNAVEKGSGATARVLWSELGESLAQRLAARLGMGN